MASVRFARFRPEDLLGPLNEVERKNAPEWLYLAGDAGLLRLVPRVAIVGARDASAVGLARASKLACELVAHGVVVVSGLAEGIDTAVHRAAINAGGRTIAVLGTPLADTYPRGNVALQRRIMKCYLAVSQFPPRYAPSRANFPRRNRTMALLTDATVIVEAGDRSGSLWQAWEALRLGRRLFIVRSAVENATLKWPAEMLRYGAEVLTKTEDLLETLPDAGDAVVDLAF